MRALAIAPDGSWLATSSTDAYRVRTVRIWDPATGREQATLTGLQDRVTMMAIAPDGSWLATSNDESVIIWRAANWRQSAILPGSLLDIAPDGSWLSTSTGSTVPIWDTATGRKRAILTGFKDEVRITAVAHDGTLLATANRTRSDSDSDWTVQVWDPATGSAHAAMRVENTILTCAWLGTRGLVIGGEAGLYMFDFMTSGRRPAEIGSDRIATV